MFNPFSILKTQKPTTIFKVVATAASSSSSIPKTRCTTTKSEKLEQQSLSCLVSLLASPPPPPPSTSSPPPPAIYLSLPHIFELSSDLTHIIQGFNWISLSNSYSVLSFTRFPFHRVINPLVYGEYPKVMQQNAGKRLPRFSEAEAELVKGAFDFIGLNHYRTAYVSDSSNAGPIHRLRDYNQDMFAYITDSRNETPGGQFIPPPTVHSDPAGLQKMLEYLKNKYGNPPIYIQENGYMLNGKDILNDTDRINFLNDYIGSMHSAIREGSDVRGYFVWSFLDVWEFLGGYRSRFGLYYVDFEDSELRREPKLSAHWYYNFIMNKKGAHIHRPGPQKVSHTAK